MGYVLNSAVLLLTLSGLVCLLQVSGKVLVATVSMSKIKGTVTFTQSSDPNTVTTIKLNLEGTDEMIDLRIHTLPMIYKGCASVSCSSSAVGAVFDPISSNTTASCSTVKQRDCAIGDLFGKIGSISKANQKNSFDDPKLPLSGKYGIYGRTLVFTTASGVKACAIITSAQTSTFAVAFFKGPVAGTVYFRQPSVSEGTLFYANLFFVNDMTILKEFDLKIHLNLVSERKTSDQCSKVGQIFNPFNSNGVGCRKDNHAGCRVGDLWKKIGPVKVTMATSNLSSSQVAITDVNLPVTGDNTIIGHSLVLYRSDNPSTPIACTNILKLLPKKAKAVFVKEATDGVSGTFVFSQASPFDPTEVDINIMNLRSMAEGFHVHEYPNPSYKGITSNTQACSALNAGDHLNPYGIDASKSPSSGTFDEYEIGDLSAKYGSFLNQNNRAQKRSDFNLPLFGKNSIVGRSIVIHKLKRDGNKRWVCRNINLDMSGITKMETRSHFTGPDILGDIVMTQYKIEDDKASPLDTAIYLDLKHVKGEKTKKHNWHVHDNPVGDDMNKGMSDGRCNSLGPHYNPFNVYLKGNYASTCTPDNPLRCELGDSSAKTARYDLGAGPRFYTDVDTPLFGPQSVVGRGFVVHTEDAGAPRQGCADIKPNTALFKEKTLNILTLANFSKAEFITKMANHLDTDQWRISYVRNTAGHVKKCTRITFGIIDDSKVSKNFDTIAKDNPNKLTPYIPNSDCNHSERLPVCLTLIIIAVIACFHSFFDLNA